MSKTLKITPFISVTILVIVISVVLCVFFVKNSFSASPNFHSVQLLPEPKALTNFSLETQRGEEFTAKNFSHYWSLIFFGFTSCPEMCPLELQELTKVLKMAQKNGQTPLRVIFISLDPERDTRDVIEKYLATFNPDIIGLRGENKELAGLSHSFTADYHRSATLTGSPLNIPAGINMPADVESDYQVEHSGRIYLVNPHGQYIGSFSQPHNAHNIWADLQLILKR